ncbi:MAG: hypothetical protein K2X90_01220 [Candidatus Babeliaceae bacterium]|nr:hypothetical protein [Candidatus Babeliaceae bacterium]
MKKILLPLSILSIWVLPGLTIQAATTQEQTDSLGEYAAYKPSKGRILMGFSVPQSAD